MKWLSFNYWGLPSPSKKLALKHMISLNKINIIFLQETLGPSDDID